MPSGFIIFIWIGAEVRRIAGAAGRGNVKGAAAGRAAHIHGVCDEPVVLLRERAAPPGEGVVLRDEVRAPGVDLTRKIGAVVVPRTG
jgi:hypothetical protein